MADVFLNEYRGDWCRDMRLERVGKAVHLAGWVDVIRDHGGVLFFHLRDESSAVQIVFDPQEDQALFDRANQISRESVISIRGTVRKRPEGMEMTTLDIKDVEVLVSSLVVHNDAAPPPFSPDEADKVHEDVRLTYRYIELRQQAMQQRLRNRHRFLQTVRQHLSAQDFVEVETPVLTKSTPEGARDYLVPSRVHQGKFYALPQSPQLFKQLLMVGGLGRYFQVARCFRDEDLRANRQPEFTQIDLEASFVSAENLIGLTEAMFSAGLQAIGHDVQTPFPRMTYDEAFSRYGTDAPDVRFAFEMVELSDIFGRSDLTIFKNVVKRGGKVYGIKVGSHEYFTKGAIERLRDDIMAEGAGGMAWAHNHGGKFVSPIGKFVKESLQNALMEAMDLSTDGDLMVFMADTPRKAQVLAGKLRILIADRLGLRDPQVLKPLWITDFPLFEWDANSKRIASNHHPFTLPQEPEKLGNADRDELLAMKAHSYDLVLNGQELGSGSLRIHDAVMQRHIFELLGMDSESIEVRFGFFLRALGHGAPPHGGIALGVDRIMQILSGVESIRDVIAFPKNKRGLCPLSDAPSDISFEQAHELGLRLKKKSVG